MSFDKFGIVTKFNVVKIFVVFFLISFYSYSLITSSHFGNIYSFKSCSRIYLYKILYFSSNIFMQNINQRSYVKTWIFLNLMDKTIWFNSMKVAGINLAISAFDKGSFILIKPQCSDVVQLINRFSTQNQGKILFMNLLKENKLQFRIFLAGKVEIFTMRF